MRVEVPVKPFIPATPKPRMLWVSPFVLNDIWNRFSFPVDDILSRGEDEMIEDLLKEKSSSPQSVPRFLREALAISHAKFPT